MLVAASRRAVMPAARRSFSTGATFPPSASRPRHLHSLSLAHQNPAYRPAAVKKGRASHDSRSVRCAVKTGRPDVGELSRGQNKVREVSAVFMDNVTPTWKKGGSDGIVNIVGNCIQGFGFLLIVRRAPCCACADRRACCARALSVGSELLG